MLYYPAFRDPAALKDQLARGSFYLSYSDTEQVYVITDLPGRFEFSRPSGFEPRITELYEKLAPRLTFLHPIRDRAQIRSLLAQDTVLLWNQDIDPEEQSLVDDALRNQRAWRVDPETVRYEGSFYVSAGFEQLSNVSEIKEQCRRKFLRLCRRFEGTEKAYLLCTGPSVSQYRNFDFSDGLSIVCNTTILDRALMDYVGPNLLVFADPIFHFGCSQYAAKFRDAVRSAVEEYDLDVLIPLKHYPLFTSLAPEVKDRVIGIPLASNGAPNMDVARRFRVRSVDNILTLLMLPIASTLVSREVYVIGCDGRPLEEKNHFWKHNPKTQLVDLMDNIKEVHPAFSRSTTTTIIFRTAKTWKGGLRPERLRVFGIVLCARRTCRPSPGAGQRCPRNESGMRYRWDASIDT